MSTQLIAKIRSEYKNILSRDENILDDFDISVIEEITFATGYKLEDKEWFIINDFSIRDFFIQQCNSDFSFASINQIGNNDYKKISSISIFQNGQIHFQRITPALFVNRKTVLSYSREPRIVEQRNQIEIRAESNAIYSINSDKLYFKTIGKLKDIFPGIEGLHKEATQDEVDAFVENEFISLSGITNTSIGVLNRKRIADIGGKFNALNDQKKEQLITYAKEKAGVDIEGDSFVIKSETDLKKLLYALDERYYYAEVHDEDRVANSVHIVNNR